MQVLVTFRHMDPTLALRRYAEKKVQRVHKVMRHPIEAHVILDVNKRLHVAEITLSGEHFHVAAKESTGDMYSAIDLAMEKIERQIQKRVSKRLAHRHEAPATAAAPPRRRTAKPAVSTERVTVEQMSIADAVRRLGRDGADVLLFLNEATETLNVLYRRRDGGYGLVEPEVA
ncbi:MAG: ribosome-associated translation inhibitor RaiA [Candidatus Binatia bacterium]